MWAFREAVASKGYYSSAESADEYYKRLYKELDSAFSDGRLTRKESFHSPLVAFMSKEQLPEFLNNLLKTTEYIVEYRDIAFDPYARSIGDVNDLQNIEKLAHNKSIYDGEHINLAGWLVSNEPSITLQIENKASNEKVSLGWNASPDVSSYFESQKKAYMNMDKARFNKSVDNGSYLQIQINNEVVDEIPLDGSIMSKQTERYVLHFDSVKGQELKKYGVDGPRINILNGLNSIYRSFVKYVYLFGMLCFIYLVKERFCKCKQEKSILKPLVLISTALVLTAIVRIIVIAYNTTAAFPAISYMYLSPCYTLLMAFSLLNIFGLLMYLNIGGSENSELEKEKSFILRRKCDFRNMMK